jgi:trehalose transport system permease protein
MMPDWRRLIRSCIAPAVLVIAVIYIITPLYLMLQISLGTPEAILTQHPPLITFDLTLSHWMDIFSSGQILPPLLKSLAVATLAMIGTILVATPAAYAIARLPAALAYTIVIILLLSRMVPEVSIALPVSIAFLRLGLLDTYIGLALAHMIRTLPLVTWILVGTFRSIPSELEEASRIDGCTKWRTLRWVVLPLAAPGLAVGCIFSWLESWNEFLYALYLTLLRPTMPIQILYYAQRGSWFHSATYTMILIVPVLLVVLFFQRRIRTEYLTVGLKG